MINIWTHSCLIALIALTFSHAFAQPVTAEKASTPQKTSTDVSADKKDLEKIKAQITQTPPLKEPISAAAFLDTQEIPLATEEELRKRRSMLIAKNTELKRKEFLARAQITVLKEDPSLSQLPAYSTEGESVTQTTEKPD
ncbi:MAG: hypothetical protein H6849_03175 [Alphaproteobacteria bacterium]|nr:MAG: hypothetical protein H6849_03175 [Alphaproteobacteria bacterium]